MTSVDTTASVTFPALGTTAATLTGWQDSFVAAGEASLATRSTDGAALETERLKAKLGEMLLERELLEAKIPAASLLRTTDADPARSWLWPRK